MVRLPCFLNRQWTHFTTVSKRKGKNYSFLQTTVAGGFCNVKNTSEVLIVWLCPSKKTRGPLTKNLRVPILSDRKFSQIRMGGSGEGGRWIHVPPVRVAAPTPRHAPSSFQAGAQVLNWAGRPPPPGPGTAPGDPASVPVTQLLGSLPRPPPPNACPSFIFPSNIVVVRASSFST